MALVDITHGKQRHVPYRDSKLTFLLRVSKSDRRDLNSHHFCARMHLRSFMTFISLDNRIHWEEMHAPTLSLTFTRLQGTYVSSDVQGEYLTVILRTRVVYELIADEVRSTELAIKHIRRE